MVGIAVLMLLTVATGLVLIARKRLDESGWYLRLCQPMGAAGFIAVIASWTTTEVGRQPWTIYGLLRTADSVTPSLSGSDVLVSLLLYVIIYPVGVLLRLRMVWRGPKVSEEAGPVEAGHPKGPIEALQTGAAS